MSEQMKEAQDWLVSVTPAPRGDWLSPEGLRFNLTMHNGATAEMVQAVVAEMDKLADILKPANGHSTPPPAAASAPATAPQQQAQGDGEGMEVYIDGGKRWLAKGEEFVVDIDRIEQTSVSGKPALELFRPGNKWAFTKATLRHQLDDLSELPTGNLSEPVPMVFKVGNKKKESDNHYIDFVGLPSGNPPQEPAQPDPVVQTATEELGAEVVHWGEDPQRVAKFNEYAESLGLDAEDAHSILELSISNGTSAEEAAKELQDRAAEIAPKAA